MGNANKKPAEATKRLHEAIAAWDFLAATEAMKEGAHPSLYVAPSISHFTVWGVPRPMSGDTYSVNALGTLVSEVYIALKEYDSTKKPLRFDPKRLSQFLELLLRDPGADILANVDQLTSETGRVTKGQVNFVDALTRIVESAATDHVKRLARVRLLYPCLQLLCKRHQVSPDAVAAPSTPPGDRRQRLIMGATDVCAWASAGHAETNKLLLASNIALWQHPAPKPGGSSSASTSTSAVPTHIAPPEDAHPVALLLAAVDGGSVAAVRHLIGTAGTIKPYYATSLRVSCYCSGGRGREPVGADGGRHHAPHARHRPVGSRRRQPRRGRGGGAPHPRPGGGAAAGTVGLGIRSPGYLAPSLINLVP